MRAAALWLAVALSLPAPREEVSVHFAPTGERRALEAAIVAELRDATRDIDVALYRFSSDRLLRALAARRREGVAVRVLLDREQSDDAFVRRLRGAGLEVRLVVPREEAARFHHKYAVLDARIVITGSYNWTVLGDASNHENLVILRREPAARSFHEDFENTWQDPELSRP